MKTKVLLFIQLVLAALLISLGNAMTTTPGRSSGNGNPAIILFVPLMVIFIVLVIQWINLLKDRKLSLRAIIIVLLLIIGHYTLGIYYQFISYRNYRSLLAQVYADEYGHIDWSYIDSITTGLSIHINNQYFNVNTYFLFVSLSLFLSLLYPLIQQIRHSRL